MHSHEPRIKAWETAEPGQSISRNSGLSGTLQGGPCTYINATASISQQMSSRSSSQQQLSSHSHSHWKRLLSSSVAADAANAVQQQQEHIIAEQQRQLEVLRDALSAAKQQIKDLSAQVAAATVQWHAQVADLQKQLARMAAAEEAAAATAAAAAAAAAARQDKGTSQPYRVPQKREEEGQGMRQLL